MAKITDNYHFIPIIEPSIRNGQGYAYEEGKKRNVFIQSAEGEDQIGEVWAGKVVFPDFFHPNGTNYWVDML
jgi:alpha-glucosidase (family GH31 glycosyl hydrolase)